MEKELKIYFGMAIFLLCVITGSLAVVTTNVLDTPDKISPSSVKTMTCQELLMNFAECRESSSMYWDYCAEVYLPLYYERC